MTVADEVPVGDTFLYEDILYLVCSIYYEDDRTTKEYINIITGKGNDDIMKDETVQLVATKAIVI